MQDDNDGWDGVDRDYDDRYDDDFPRRQREAEDPVGFTRHYGLLSDPHEDWVIGDVSMATDEGVVIHSAAYNTRTDELIGLCPDKLSDNGDMYHGYELLDMPEEGKERREIRLAQLPDTVRDGLLEVMEELVAACGVKIAPEVRDEIIGFDERFDEKVAEEARHFDPRQLLPPALSAEEERLLAQFHADLGGQAGERALRGLIVDEAKIQLEEQRINAPEDKKGQAVRKAKLFQAVDDADRVEPESTPTYGYENKRLSQTDFRTLVAHAERDEDAAVKRAKDWVKRTSGPEGGQHQR